MKNPFKSKTNVVSPAPETPVANAGDWDSGAGGPVAIQQEAAGNATIPPVEMTAEEVAASPDSMTLADGFAILSKARGNADLIARIVNLIEDTARAMDPGQFISQAYAIKRNLERDEKTAKANRFEIKIINSLISRVQQGLPLIHMTADDFAKNGHLEITPEERLKRIENGARGNLDLQTILKEHSDMKAEKQAQDAKEVRAWIDKARARYSVQQ